MQENCLMNTVLLSVTVEEICANANVSKGTYYKYLTNKEDAALHIANIFLDDSKKRFNDMILQNLSFEELIIGLLDLKKVFMEEYSEKFLIELYKSNNQDIQKTLSALQASSLANALTIYEIGIKQDKIRKQYLT